MANQEHLEILKQGVDVWNQWRKEYAKIRPDLGFADLSNLNLGNADLSNTNLSQVLFWGTNLSGAVRREVA